MPSAFTPQSFNGVVRSGENRLHPWGRAIIFRQQFTHRTDIVEKTHRLYAPMGGHGWHAARRGLGTNLYRLGVPDKVIQAILRHSNVTVTLGYYIKPQAEDVIAAMSRLEAEMAAHELRDSNGTVNQPSGTMSKTVN